MPPWGLPGMASQSGIFSHSLKGGPTNGNMLRFDDKTGAEEVKFLAEKDLNTTVKNNETHTVMVDRTKTIVKNETISVGEDRNATITKMMGFPSNRPKPSMSERHIVWTLSINLPFAAAMQRLYYTRMARLSFAENNFYCTPAMLCNSLAVELI